MAMKFGKYLLEKQLAIGGMAEVFLAHQEGPAGFRKTLCIKRILPNFANDAAFIEMFLDEARTAAQLSHPNIVQIYELGEIDGSYYIAMEYIRGPSLSKVIRRLKQTNLNVPLHYAAKIIANVCAGLEYAHTFADSEGQPLHLVHRDISPDNVLVSFAGAVKMIDFGIAKAKTNQSKTQAGAVKGKFSYMSPEQIMGSTLDGRSDLFSLGIVLYELTTLRKPFGEDADLMTVSAIVNDPPPLPADLYEGYPPGLQSVILRALAKDRRERFSTAQEMQNELERFIHEQGEFLSERDVGNYMTRLFSESAEDVETLRQLGSGVRMKLTGVPVVKPSTRVGAEEETRVAEATGHTVTPSQAETGEIEPPATVDPDATRQVAPVKEPVEKPAPKAQPKPERAVEPRPEAPAAEPPRKQAQKAPPRTAEPTPAPTPGVEGPEADPGGGSKKGLYIGLGALAAIAVAVGIWFVVAPPGGGSSGGAAQATSGGGGVASTGGSGETGPGGEQGTPPKSEPDAGSTAAAKDAVLLAAADTATVKAVDAGPTPQVDTTQPTAADASPMKDAGAATAADAGAVPPQPDAGAVPPAADAGAPPPPVDAGAAPSPPDATAAPKDAGGAEAGVQPTGADAGAPQDTTPTGGDTTESQSGTGVDSGKVRVTAEPTMDVYWAGEKQGRTPLTLELPTGRHTLKLRGADGLRKSVGVTVEKDRQVSSHVTAVRGVVMFEVERGVQVTFDGTSLGTAPVKLQQAWEGNHTVVFRHPDGRSVQRNIEISKAQPKVLVRHKF